MYENMYQINSLTPAPAPPYYEDFDRNAVLGSLQEAAQKICKHESEFAPVKHTIRLFPLTVTNAVDILSERSKPWLEGLYQDLFTQPPPEHDCNGSWLAQQVVGAIMWRPPPKHWDGDWIVPDLMGAGDILAIARRIEREVSGALCAITLSDLVAMCLGCSSLFENLLCTAISVRDELIRYNTSPQRAWSLKCLQKELSSNLLLAQWMLSSAISSNPSLDTAEPLGPFTHRIKQQLMEQRSDFPRLVQHLILLESFFALKIPHSIEENWHVLLAVDFPLWESFKSSPQTLAVVKTKSVFQLFLAIPIGDYLTAEGSLENIGREWSDFCSNIASWLMSSPETTPSVMKLAEYFLQLKNLHAATAIGMALKRAKIQIPTNWWAWEFIDPSSNFAGSERVKGRRIPFMNRRVMEYQRGEVSGDKIMELLNFAVFFARETDREESTHNTIPSQFTDNIRLPWPVHNNHNSSQLKSTVPLARDMPARKRPKLCLSNHQHQEIQDSISSCGYKQQLREATRPPQRKLEKNATTLCHALLCDGREPIRTADSIFKDNRFSGFTSQLLSPVPPSHASKHLAQTLNSERTQRSLNCLEKEIRPPESSQLAQNIIHFPVHGGRERAGNSPATNSAQEPPPLVMLNTGADATCQLMHESPRHPELQARASEKGVLEIKRVLLEPLPTAPTKKPADMQRICFTHSPTLHNGPYHSSCSLNMDRLSCRTMVDNIMLDKLCRRSGPTREGLSRNTGLTQYLAIERKSGIEHQGDPAAERAEASGRQRQALPSKAGEFHFKDQNALDSVTNQERIQPSLATNDSQPYYVTGSERSSCYAPIQQAFRRAPPMSKEEMTTESREQASASTQQTCLHDKHQKSPMPCGHASKSNSPPSAERDKCLKYMRNMRVNGSKKEKMGPPQAPFEEDDIDAVDPLCLRPGSSAPILEMLDWTGPSASSNPLLESSRSSAVLPQASQTEQNHSPLIQPPASQLRLQAIALQAQVAQVELERLANQDATEASENAPVGESTEGGSILHPPLVGTQTDQVSGLSSKEPRGRICKPVTAPKLIPPSTPI